MDRLGQETTTASIYTRDGRSELLTIGGVSEVEYGRVPNAYSEARLTVLSRLDRDCWSSLGDVHTWAHTLVLHRGDERVWEGPITDVSLSQSAVNLQAFDVSAWLTRRRVYRKRITGKGVEVGVLGEARIILNRAFGADDPNVLDHVVTVADPEEPTTAREVKPNEGYYYDDLGTLVGAGLQWTTVGRSIVLGTENVLLGRTATLVPERDTTAEVTLSESGADLATAVTAANEGVVGSAQAAGLPGEGVSDFYGLHDMLTENLDRKRVEGLRKVARTAVRRRYPAPQVVTFPEGSALDPDTPIPFAHLVPGTAVPLESNATPRPVSATFVLGEVKVKQTVEGEAVTVTLLPVAG